MAAALVAAVFLAYEPAWHGGFVWDDDLHLVKNPVLQPGHFLETWVPGSYINYWPLTFSVYRLEYDMWGLNPLGFHLVNIALHAVSALLVWRILKHLQIPGAMLAAAIFAFHPVNVESVAWVAQLKNTLSLMLALCRRSSICGTIATGTGCNMRWRWASSFFRRWPRASP